MTHDPMPQDPVCLDLYGPHDPLVASCAACASFRRVREDERKAAAQRVHEQCNSQDIFMDGHWWTVIQRYQAVDAAAGRKVRRP